MLEILLAATIAVIAAAALAVAGSRLLLGWYLREVGRMKIAEQPSEAIVTYPLA